MRIGVDIGGSTIRVAAVGDDGLVARRERVLISERAPGAIVEATARAIEALSTEPSPVGVAIAAMLQGDVVANAPNLGWRDVDFGGLLRQRLGRDVRLLNDLSAAALGEHRAGASKGASDVFTVFVGTGVGSAIIEGGQLQTGATGVAGEFGHVKLVASGGRECGCGQRGCLEAYMGGARLEAWMKEEGLSGSPADLEREAGAGNATAVKLYDFAAGHLALAIANQVTVLNPGVVVLGGGVLMRCPGIVERIRSTISTHSSVVSAKAVRLELARLGDDSGLVGAALS